MTEWWAFKPITTAFGKAKKLLLEPFSAWTWLKLMVIVFFVGSGTGQIWNQFSFPQNYYRGSTYDQYAVRDVINSILSNTALLALLIGLVIVLIALVLLFAYLRNVFSFVLIRALASGDVHVIKPMLENLGRGFRLFIFTLAAGIFALVVTIALVVIMALPVLLAIKLGLSTAAGIIVLILAIGLFAVLLFVLVVFAIAMNIFIGFTYDFVAPMVLFKDRGIIESWKWLWASIRKEWKQYGVYVVTRWVLGLAVALLMLFIVVPVAIVFIVVLGIGAIIALIAAKASVVLMVLIVLLLIPVLILFWLAMLAISVPVAVYFRYYSLDVLKQIDPSAVVYSGRFSPPSPPSPPAQLPV